jgi:hypothetical protein
MTGLSVAAALLAGKPREPLCANCLASMLSFRLPKARRVAMLLEGIPGYYRQHTTCSRCGKRRLTIVAGRG